MCGICGALAFESSNFTVSAEYVIRMRDVMTHRGPDGAGIWLSQDGRVGLGHRWLSIIDLSDAASQPMSNEDGSLQVVFNGEIYNHAEIRRELEQRGHLRWKTDHSDTEVILHAFQEWGIACLERFRGMFAIGLWDANSRRLWLIAIASASSRSITAFIMDGSHSPPKSRHFSRSGPDRAANEEALFHYLSFVTTPAPDTLFEGIRKLPPGLFLTISTEQHRHQYWYVLDRVTPLIGVSEEDIAERLLSGLCTSVALRTVNHVPVGIFLSGGIEKHNAALFSECASGRVKTFSVGYDNNYRGCESAPPYAKEFAASIEAIHHARVLTQEDFPSFFRA